MRGMFSAEPASIRPGLPADARLSRSARITAAIVAGLALVAYALTLMPGVAFGDWGEMQTIPHVLGVAHPTGYPTYILLAWLAELVPIGTVAFRANFLSAASRRRSARHRDLDLHPARCPADHRRRGALALGAVGTVWAAATIAEVNPLHLFLVALILDRASSGRTGGRPVDLVLGASSSDWPSATTC